MSPSCCCCQSRTYLVSGPWCIGSEPCLWQFRTKAGEGQFVTDNYWMVSGAYSRGLGDNGCHSPSVPVFLALCLPNELPCCYLLCCCLQSGFQMALKRELTEIEKSTGTCYTPGGVYITGTIMSEKSSSAQCSTKQAFKWEMTVVSTEVPETAQPILMRMKRFFDHYLRGKKTFSPF